MSSLFAQSKAQISLLSRLTGKTVMRETFRYKLHRRDEIYRGHNSGLGHTRTPPLVLPGREVVNYKTESETMLTWTFLGVANLGISF